MSNIIRIDDYKTASTAIRDDGFAAVDVASYLRLLHTESQHDLGTLIHLTENTLFFIDGARHRKLSRLSSEALVASRIAPWKPFMKQAVAYQLDVLNGRQSVDLVTDYVNPLLLKITGQILGFDTSDGARFTSWVKSARDLLEPTISLRRMSKLQVTIQTMLAHVRESQLPQSEGYPPSILSQMLNHIGPDFSRDDAVAATLVLFVASQTTAQTFSNIVLHILKEHDVRATIIHASEHSHKYRNLLEDMLRLNASPQFVDRIARRDQLVNGCPFKAGDHLHMHLPTINRDPSIFPKDRKEAAGEKNASAGHLSFGSGEHRCPGATFARSLIGIGLWALFARFPLIKLEGEPIWENTTFISAPESLRCELNG